MKLKVKIIVCFGALIFKPIILTCFQSDVIEVFELSSKSVLKNKNILKRVAAIEYQGQFSTISSWINAFRKLPKNRNGANFNQHSGFSSCGDKINQWKEFKVVLDAWLLMNTLGPLFQDTNWSPVHNRMVFKFWSKIKAKPELEFFNTTQPCRFTPFAQKLIAEPGDVFYFHGDLHGDIFSLLEEIKELRNRKVIDDNFRIIQDKVWFVFLGDYVDRGQYGCEVIYTMMRLAIANPDRVVAVRGNHEDTKISAVYGFKEEVAAKFDDKNGSKYQLISRMNDFLPVVFYLGCKDTQRSVNYLQCCHGGIEEEYNPQLFLNNLKTVYQRLPKFSDGHSNSCPFENKKTPLGFMWNDFDVDHQDIDFQSVVGRGLSYGKVGTERVLKILQSSAKSKLRGILRAHQHTCSIKDSMMKGLVESSGLYKLWKPYEKGLVRHLSDGIVWTFNVAPDSIYGQSVGFNFDTYVELKTAKDYKDWVMKVFNTTII